jgi:hypothetical protein
MSVLLLLAVAVFSISFLNELAHKYLTLAEVVDLAFVIIRLKG